MTARILQVDVLVHSEEDDSTEWFSIQTPEGWEKVVIGRNSKALVPKHNSSDSVRFRPTPQKSGQAVAIAARITAPDVCVLKGGIWICS